MMKMELPCTNNAIEAWHNGFRYQIGHPNPTLWSLIDAFKREQDRSEFELRRDDNNVDHSPVRKCTRDVTDVLKSIMSKYDDAKYKNKLKYVKAIAATTSL